jgi:hypothetical protein
MCVYNRHYSSYRTGSTNLSQLQFSFIFTKVFDLSQVNINLFYNPKPFRLRIKLTLCGETIDEIYSFLCVLKSFIWEKGVVAHFFYFYFFFYYSEMDLI